MLTKLNSTEHKVM